MVQIYMRFFLHIYKWKLKYPLKKIGHESLKKQGEPNLETTHLEHI
jgi:hypothetical protein